MERSSVFARIASILIAVISFSFVVPVANASDPWAEVLAKFAAAEAAKAAAIAAATPEAIAAAALKAAIAAADNKLLGQSPSSMFSKSIMGYNDCNSLGAASLCASGNAVQRSGVLPNTDVVKTVTFFERGNFSDNLIFTAASHGFTVGCKVQITGLASVNGLYQVREVTNNTFSVTSKETFGIYSAYLNSFNVFATPLSCIPSTASDEAVYFPKNLDVASKPITVAAIIGNVNSTTSTGNTPDPMRGAYVYAEISGPGILTLCDYSNCSPTTNSNYSYGRGTLIKLNHLNSTFQLLVGTDGTAGKATITISAANTISATPVVIATETVTFFDTPSKASLTQLAYSINGDAGAAATAVATLAVTDKDGNAIPYAHFTNLGYYASAASANTTVLPAQTALTSKTLSLQPKGALYGTSDVIVTVQNDAGATAASIAAGTSAPTGFSDAAKLIPTVKFATAAQSVIVAKNKIATLTVTPSNAGQFAPGSVQTLTFVAKDVNGLAVPDSLTASVTSVSSVATSIATQNGLAVADFASLSSLGPWGLGTVLGLDAAGTMTRTLYAPIAEGDFTLSMLLGSTNYETALALTTISAKLTVTPGAATIAATEALNAAAEALDAANAATAAANAATDAADTATAAAMEATEEVAALAVTTQAQIASMRLQNIALSKKITALTKLIVKIQKKV
jgi:hypothetical protein